MAQHEHVAPCADDVVGDGILSARMQFERCAAADGHNRIRAGYAFGIARIEHAMAPYGGAIVRADALRTD